MSQLPTIDKAHVLRTPEERFSHITDFPYTPKYAEIGVCALHISTKGHATRHLCS